MLKRVADNRDPASLAARLRRKRFALFSDLVADLPAPVRVLDVGGTPDFWRVMDWADERVRVTLLNRTRHDCRGTMESVAGDARDMREFHDREFDVVFSNSVIEHVGGLADQRAMAAEIRRVGRRYFVQTPNRYFPIEPHFLFPGFQFLPVSIRAGMLARRDVGWWPKASSYDAAVAEVTAIRLLTRREFARLFPDARLYKERFLGLTKSFIVVKGS